jgi:hypothetical protein
MKQKNDLSQISVRSILLKLALLGISLFFAGAMLIIFLFLLLNYGFRSGEVVSKLPIQLIPTAQYLADNHPTFPDSISLLPIEHIENSTIICVRLQGRLEKLGYAIGTGYFYINGSRLPYENVDHNRESDYCANVKLDAGLHLVEFQPYILKDEKYAWAINIGE